MIDRQVRDSFKMQQSNSITIIGAGLAGSLLSIYLARRGFDVTVFEARGDMREETVAAGRSINLALSDRGIAALREVGMDQYMLNEAVPMYGRMIHLVSGEKKLLPYSGREGEYINSVSRSGLNIALINEAEKYKNVSFRFNERLVGFDCSSGKAQVERVSKGMVVMEQIHSHTVIATDGAGSRVRNAMMHGGVERFNYSQTWLEHGYKELHIPSAAEWTASVTLAGDRVSLKSNDSFLLQKDALHIWPRNKFMMIALPNFDGSFTCTLFLAHKGGSPNGSEGVQDPLPGTKHTHTTGRVSAFDSLIDGPSVVDFFTREFPDACELMPTLVEDFFANPTGNLGTIKCFPWNAGGKALLLGDSAHAIVPFYGQGMNCSFEDVRVLDHLIGESASGSVSPAADEGYSSLDWESIYKEYGQLRKINTDAIADMAQENFYEMRDAVADPVFVRKRELETKLEQKFPDYFSKYSMVTFREDMPYSAAKEKGNAQDRLLMSICENEQDIGSLDLLNIVQRLRGLN